MMWKIYELKIIKLYLSESIATASLLAARFTDLINCLPEREKCSKNVLLKI